jgi:hypothetical protein
MFTHFVEAAVDLALVEVGLGGRLEATNAWDGGVAAITNWLAAEELAEAAAIRRRAYRANSSSRRATVNCASFSPKLPTRDQAMLLPSSIPACAYPRRRASDFAQDVAAPKLSFGGTCHRTRSRRQNWFRVDVATRSELYVTRQVYPT